ncbi:5'-3' exonuclease, partial [Subtercola vilae]
MAKRLMLLDTASLYFRAFYGVPESVHAPDGTPVNAVRGLLDMIARLVTEFEPDALVACWDDAWRPRWRVDLIPSYKAHRVAEEVPGGVDIEVVPENLTLQLPVIREVLETFDIAIVGAADHEADDVIGTLASGGSPATGATTAVDIVTGDRDLFQLVDDDANVRVIYTARGMSRLELVTGSVLRSKYGVDARQYVDFAVLRGDASDGLPGVAGIGEKTAATLLGQYGSLEGLRAAASGAGGDSSGPSLSASLRAKLVAASDYLDVAPRVVSVVRTLDLGPIDATLRPLSPASRSHIATLASRWALGTSATRALAALTSPAPTPT